MTLYDSAANVNAKIAGSKNPRVAAIGAAMQARTAAVRAAQAPVDKLKAFTSSLGSGLKAAKAVQKPASSDAGANFSAAASGVPGTGSNRFASGYAQTLYE